MSIVRVARGGFRLSAVINQPMWAIEEKARIFRVWVWFSPAHPPTRAEASPSVSRVFVCKWLCVRYSSASGAIFCHVEMISAVVIVEPWITSGYQRCAGAMPSFRAIAMVIIVVVTGAGVLIMAHCPVCQVFVVAAQSSRMAAQAWIRKYFVVASVVRGWCGPIMRGRMLRVFSSNPTQARSQWVLAMVVSVLAASVVSRIVQISGLISKGGAGYQHCRGMGPKA